MADEATSWGQRYKEGLISRAAKTESSPWAAIAVVGVIGVLVYLAFFRK